MRIIRVVVALALLLLLYFVVTGAAQGPTAPGPTPEQQGPCPDPTYSCWQQSQPTTAPCVSQSNGETCLHFSMTLTRAARAITEMDLQRPFSELESQSICQGRLARGTLRYFTNGTAPSALIGILVPLPEHLNGEPDYRDPLDVSGTQEGDVINLYSKELIMGFKATEANSGGAEISWECAL